MLPEFTFWFLIVEDIFTFYASLYHRVATHGTTPYEYLNVAIFLILNFNHEVDKTRFCILLESISDKYPKTIS